jgi:nickel/cobalt transporter (NicO) family protein
VALTMRRGGAALLLAFLLLLVLAAPALAHPLGNFTTNTYAGVVVKPDRVAVAHVLDLAEIPALQEIQRAGLDVDRPEGAAGYSEERCTEIAAGLDLQVDGDVAQLTVAGSRLSFPPGQAGLDTLRLECDLTTDAMQVTRGTSITLRDEVLPNRLGWREITATGDGIAVAESDVPSRSVSGRLSDYPEELLQSPLDVRAATMVAGGSGPRLAIPGAPDPVTETAGRAIDALTGLVSAQELTVGFALLALLTATGLGALHALAPGHGKTVMAAFLIGRSGAGRQALGLGATVAITHTAGVLVLGGLLSASQLVAPERVFGWLGVASGLLFAGVGVLMLRTALRNRGGHHHHHHHHGHGHDPRGQGGDDGHETRLAHVGSRGTATEVHGASQRPAGRPLGELGETQVNAAPQRHAGDGDHHHHLPEPGSGWRGLVAPGLAGGLVPSPSALVVLLGGLALGRAWFGVSLVIAYGIGMAGTLVALGYLLVRARDRIGARVAAASSPDSRIVRITRQLPVVMATLIIVGGLVIAVRFALQPGA